MRCDGKKPKCSLCTRLNRPCDYVKVTAEENAVLRDKKRQSKARKNAEQEAARANFHKHDTFPAYHPYRSNGSVASAHHRNSVGDSDDRNSLHAPPLPHVATAAPSSSSAAVSSSSSVLQPYLYDARYQSGTAAATALFDIGAGLSGSRRPSLTNTRSGPAGYAYPRKQSIDGYARAAEPRSRYDALIPSNDASWGAGLSVVTPPAPVLPASTLEAFPSAHAHTFRTHTATTGATDDTGDRYRYVGAAAFAPQPSTAEYELGSPTYNCTQGGYFDRERSSAWEPNTCTLGSVSPSVASPSYLPPMPALERAPSSSGSGASASPVSHSAETTPPHHDDAALWNVSTPLPPASVGYAAGHHAFGYRQDADTGEVAKVNEPFGGSVDGSPNTSVESWASHVPLTAPAGKSWDGVVTLYSATM